MPKDGGDDDESVKVTVYLPGSLAEALRDACYFERRKKQDVLRQAVADWIAAHGARLIEQERAKAPRDEKAA